MTPINLTGNAGIPALNLTIFEACSNLQAANFWRLERSLQTETLEAASQYIKAFGGDAAGSAAAGRLLLRLESGDASASLVNRLALQSVASTAQEVKRRLESEEAMRLKPEPARAEAPAVKPRVPAPVPAAVRATPKKPQRGVKSTVTYFSSAVSALREGGLTPDFVALFPPDMRPKIELQAVILSKDLDDPAQCGDVLISFFRQQFDAARQALGRRSSPSIGLLRDSLSLMSRALDAAKAIERQGEGGRYYAAAELFFRECRKGEVTAPLGEVLDAIRDGGDVSLETFAMNIRYALFSNPL